MTCVSVGIRTHYVDDLLPYRWYIAHMVNGRQDSMLEYVYTLLIPHIYNIAGRKYIDYIRCMVLGLTQYSFSYWGCGVTFS